MARISPAAIWMMRLLFVAISLLVVFFHLLPLDTLPRRWSPPDLLLVLALAWATRRPDFVPPLLIVAVMLMADLLLQRPPGLWSALVLLGCEFAKSRLAPQREMPFLAEWFAITVVIVAMTVLNRMILSVTGVAQPHVALLVLRTIMTIVAYPVAVAISQQLLGVRRLSQADLEALGARS